MFRELALPTPVADLDRLAARRTTIDLGQPGFPDNDVRPTTGRAGS